MRTRDSPEIRSEPYDADLFYSELDQEFGQVFPVFLIQIVGGLHSEHLVQLGRSDRYDLTGERRKGFDIRLHALQ